MYIGYVGGEWERVVDGGKGIKKRKRRGMGWDGMEGG